MPLHGEFNLGYHAGERFRKFLLRFERGVGVSHRGDWDAFVLGELQSLCEPCHNRGKRLLDERGYTNDIDEDGWPTDPRYPANSQG